MPYWLLLCCSVVIFFVLYAVQPLLALFAQQYQVSPASAGSLMTLTMLPLAIAPLFYGVFLNRRNLYRVLQIVMLVLAFSNALVPLCTEFWQLQSLRLLQGLALPAALTAMTASIALRFKGEDINTKMSGYIGSTIAGGFLGRALAAGFAEYLSWQSFFWLNSLLLLLLALLIRAKTEPVYQAHTPWRGNIKALATTRIISLYGAVFCMFFCFAALLNYLPFILRSTYAMSSTKNIGLVYSGYLLGALATLITPYLHRRFRNVFALLGGVFIFYCATIVLMFYQHLSVFLIAFTCFCAAMFIIHASAAPLVNRLSSASASLTNGVYVSFYYSGGALGSFLPGLLYQEYGEYAFLTCILLVCLMGYGLIVLPQRLATGNTKG
ncbi:MFS transporter [Pseudoalteromonas sp. T1lg10]|uniref:MFS transporter n=1 Tax=Pseudoalteromonas sp. T1lg10 TaxID=2077093 RepID=UPI000CF5F20D|nr:MFS transporter [Pseudoalteromonas sp. T1lg10]